MRPVYNGFLAFTLEKKYRERLVHHETTLKAIIQNYEIRKQLGSETEPITASPKDTTEVAIHLFNRMQFHPKIIKASKSLFETGHYSPAIFEAFKAVNNFVKQKTGLSLDGKALMAQVFRQEDPIIKLSELGTQSDHDEQEGFKFLFMGAMVGIRNPKAHDNVVQTDPFRTLEYLALASLLMKRVEEGKVVKTRPPRKQWNLQRFLNDIESRCSQEEINVIKEIYNFTKENADNICWGTGADTGSFTFHKLKPVGIISIISVYSDGSISFNFGYMKDKEVRKDILESFRDKLNRIPSIKIPQNAAISNKFPSIKAEILTEQSNIKVLEQAILELCQQLDEEG
jgi:uncharacterized protein (TIGR02391 family)